MSFSITTDRLLIRPLTMADAPFIFELVNTTGWLKFIGDRNVHSEADAKAYIQRIVENPDTDYWVARLQSNDVLIGIVTFIKRDYLKFHDIGFAFLPQYVNNGYAYEATIALLNHLIHNVDLTRISSITHENNSNAFKLVKKLGLEFINDIEIKNETLQLYEADVNKILIAGITNLFFSVFTNKGGTNHKLDALQGICTPEVLIINRCRSKANISDLVSFIDRRRRILSDGTLIEFEEKEIFEETKIVNGIATRFSEYEKKGILYKHGFKMKGYKIFQFVKIDRTWKISSILWEDVDD